MNSPTLRLSGLDTWQHFQQIFTVKVPLIDDLRIMSEESQADEIAKYKRVLSLARSSLEANQSTIAAKDQQIAQLIKALEEEKSNNKAKRVLAKEEEAALVPRRILCRVDVEDFIWILIEYEEFDDAWKRMQDEQDLEDFIQRVPGVPLICPAKCLSSDESRKIMDDSKQRVERIVEEFRRYKVRTEIAKKQKDAEARQAVINGTTLSSGSTIPANYSNNLTPFERALTLNSGDHVQTHGDGAAEIARLRETLAEQETKWKKLYESVAKENEVLRSKGGESLLATQWRGRYEACMKEKEELTDKLELYNAWTSQVNASGKSMDQAYIEVQEQFLAFRKKIAAIDRRRQRNTASMLLNSSSGAAGEAGSGDLLIHPTAGHPIESDLSVLLREYEQQSSRASYSSSSLGSPRHAGSTGNGHGSNSSAYRSGGGTIASLEDDNTGADGSTGMTASKIKYVRHMVLQYLSCREPEVRAHIETALMAIFRLSPAEREVVESKRREETTDALSSISSFLGSLGT